MTARIPALVEPELLVWARGCLHLSLELAAMKISVKPERLEGWESGTSQPSIPQLRKIANVYKMPIATFYMERPPRGYTIMRDLRRVAEAGRVPFSSELSLEIQNAHYHRESALELYELLDYNVPTFDMRITITRDIDTTASLIRNMLGVSRHTQVNLQNNYEAFRFRKNALETNGILVLQTLNVTVDEMGGFSIWQMPLPCVVVNVHDWVLARIFTMIHELAHISLHIDGICDLFDESEDEDKKALEQFCNYIAGAV
jgi:transcriptional regulator with XRE-family HTH domain